MPDLLQTIQRLVADGAVRVSEHGYNELAEDNIAAKEVVAGITTGLMLEAYPAYPKGPCVLVLQHDANGAPIHVVWGIPAGATSPAVLVTAYRPDPERWDKDFTRRRK